MKEGMDSYKAPTGEERSVPDERKESIFERWKRGFGKSLGKAAKLAQAGAVALSAGAAVEEGSAQQSTLAGPIVGPGVITVTPHRQPGSLDAIAPIRRAIEGEKSGLELVADILAPVSVVIDLGKKEQTATIDVPYRYARLFDRGEPKSEKDFDEMRSYIEKRLQETLLTLHGFDFSKRQYYDVFDSPRPRVKAISVIGSASPEARVRGSEQPGVIDKENLKLADMRTGNAARHVSEGLTVLGVAHEKGKIRTMGEELQFSDTELKTLETMVEGYKNEGKKNVLDLIKAYNYPGDKKLIPQTREELDRIVASKRKVEVLITFADKEEKIVIPIPLLLFLVPFLFRQRKGEPNHPRSLAETLRQIIEQEEKGKEKNERERGGEIEHELRIKNKKLKEREIKKGQRAAAGKKALETREEKMHKPGIRPDYMRKIVISANRQKKK